eukprot:TRINITY_DN86057_c0_g1_i1.p1 TRINITY_DN86057_c0_g1~~TRINITY_DN86057_c0_g1_i1.p1  ORF type:complete len:377 (+),score=63.07 TRINITY_DN86057_c0_g1_i1:61-1131(+)
MAWLLLLAALPQHESAGADHSIEAWKRGEPCWVEPGEQEQSCCKTGGFRGKPCFDAMFTRKECCSTGVAMVRLPPLTWFAQPGEIWKAAWSTGQRRFERLVQNATVVDAVAVDENSELRMRYFKQWSSWEILSGRHTLSNSRESIAKKLTPGELQPFCDKGYRWAIDVGANLGLTSLTLLKLHPCLKVVAIEPSPYLYRYLLWNLRAHKLAHRCLAFNIGVSSESSTAVLHHHEHRSSIGSIDGKFWGENHWKNWGRLLYPVPVAPLRQILETAKLSVRDISLVKLDCEGCEADLGSFPELWEAVDSKRLALVAELHNIEGQKWNESLVMNFCGDRLACDNVNVSGHMTCDCSRNL